MVPAGTGWVLEYLEAPYIIWSVTESTLFVGEGGEFASLVSLPRVGGDSCNMVCSIVLCLTYPSVFYHTNPFHLTFTLSPYVFISVLASWLRSQKYLMSIAYNRWHLIVLLTMPAVVVLSIWMGVGGCGCLVSSKMKRLILASCLFRNSAPSSASAADAATSYRIVHVI